MDSSSQLHALLESQLAAEVNDSDHQPSIQTYCAFSQGEWVPVAGESGAAAANLSAFRLITWNIDMLIPFKAPRMNAALNYLQSVVEDSPPSLPIVIFFQEMGLSDLKQICAATWVQQRFYVTDINTHWWRNHYYGTTTLVDRRLPIKCVFRVPWVSKFDRDGLFVDVALHPDPPAEKEAPASAAPVLRLCNSHLESLVSHPPIRPLQVQAAGMYMHPNPSVAVNSEQKEHVYAAAFAGDLNAIQPFDRTLHTENRLRDAYLELGGEEDEEDGYTWGYQSRKGQKERFGCSRMDKVLFCGGLSVQKLERIGVGVKVDCDETRKQMVEVGLPEYVTDHYGLMVDLKFEGMVL